MNDFEFGPNQGYSEQPRPVSMSFDSPLGVGDVQSPIADAEIKLSVRPKDQPVQIMSPKGGANTVSCLP